MFSNFIHSLQRVTFVLLVLAISIVLFVLYQPTVALGNTQLPEPDVNQVRCSADGTSATLSWDPVREGDTYALRLDDFNGNNSSCTDGWYCGTGADVLDDSYGQTSYTARNLTPGTTYEWWVHRKNYNTWDGISDWTKRTFSCPAPVTSEEEDVVKLPEPDVNQVRCSADGTSATLSWDPVREGDTYALRLDDFVGNNSSCADGWYCGTGADVLDDSYGQTSYTARNLTPGTTYEWWVHRKNYNTWDGISDWTKRTFSCPAPAESKDEETEIPGDNQGAQSLGDVSQYFNSSAIPAGKAIGVLEEAWPHRAISETLADGSKVVYLGKNFRDSKRGWVNENYDVKSIGDNSIVSRHEVYEWEDYVRRWSYVAPQDPPANIEAFKPDVDGMLWIPRYPVAGKPYLSTYATDRIDVQAPGDFSLNSNSSSYKELITWADHIPMDVRINAIGYQSNHLMRITQQWHPCVIEEYEYAENVGLVNWRSLHNVECLDLKQGQTYTLFGDIDGGITYQGKKNGVSQFVDSEGRSLKVVQKHDYVGDGTLKEFVYIRDEFSIPYYDTVVEIQSSDWSLEPTFVGDHVDDLPHNYNFTPVDSGRQEGVTEPEQVESEKPSSVLKKYMWITTNSNLNVRSQASTNSAVVGVVPAGTSGIIFGGPVYADGYTWWDVYYLNGTRGYSVENWLAPRTFGNVKGVQTTASWEDNLVEKLRQLQYTLGRFLSTL